MNNPRSQNTEIKLLKADFRLMLTNIALSTLCSYLITSIFIPIFKQKSWEIDFDKFPRDTRDFIYKSKPGITGIGSIIFRDEEKWISNF